MRKILYLLVLAGTAACAGPLTFSMSSTFNAGTSNTPYFAPGETWSVSLTINSTPTVISDFTGQFTHVAISNVVYLVNGVQTYTGDDSMYFYATPFYNGGFDLCLDSNCSFGLAGNGGVQMYTGTETAPLFAPGSFPMTIFNAYYFPVGQGTPIESAQTNPTIGIVSAGVPEPSSFYLSILGLAALALVIARRR
jgi:hypothetical protein